MRTRPYVGSHYLKQAPGPDAIERWKAFLWLYRKDLVEIDFFTVPTLSSQILYVPVLLHHHRRRVIHFAVFAVTALPTADWICQQSWQNGVAERWIGSVRRELLEPVGVFHEQHLHRLLSEYVAYYLDDRPHLALEKDAPTGRPVKRAPRADAQIVALPHVGGLHYRYAWQVAA